MTATHLLTDAEALVMARILADVRERRAEQLAAEKAQLLLDREPEQPVDGGGDDG